MNNENFLHVGRVMNGTNITPVQNIALDYEAGTLVLDGVKIEEPVLVTVHEPDGWNIQKIFNYSGHLDCKRLPEVIVEARGFEKDL